jgi:CheY-like chemotaxis protein
MARYSQLLGWKRLKVNMNKKIVAIFEDDPVNRFVYRRSLRKRKDIDVYIFNDSEKGISTAAEFHFDIVFIEIHFRGNFEGITILNRLKEILQKQVIFIAMTSLLQKDDLERALSAGFSMCIEKPVNFSEINFSGQLKNSNDKNFHT